MKTRRFFAGVIAVSMILTAPDPVKVWAKGTDLQELPVLSGVESEYDDTDYGYEEGTWTEDTERGEYVIFAEDAAEVPTEQLTYVDDLADNMEDTVYEADLSAEQLEELEQEGDIHVEENFFLFGADMKSAEITHGILSGGEAAEEGSVQEEDESVDVADGFDDETEMAGNGETGSSNAGGGENDGDAGTDIGMTNGDDEDTGMTTREDEKEDWNYRMIHAEAFESEENKQPVKVAVLDSGIELISGIPVYDSVNLVKEEQDLPYYMNDMVGHGTAVADIIHNICPEAQIYAVRALNRENKGRLGDIVEGIYWCMEQDVDIINMSFGTAVESEILRKAIQAATDQGILIVGSAGNGGSGAAVEYPAAFDEVIAVGAVDTCARKTEESAAGPEVELVAPGEQIIVKSLFGMETVSSGTSMAAPHVTGAAAALMSMDGEKDAAQIRMILDASGNPLGDSEEYGSGLVDLEYAAQLLEEDTLWDEGADAQEGGSGEAGNGNMPKPDGREEAPTFEEIDFVEGRWKTEEHPIILQEGLQIYEYTAELNDTEIKLLKAGSAYPDQNINLSGKPYPEWHGQFRDSSQKAVNYIANYIFATKIARAGGDTSGLARVKGQEKGCYNRMKKKVSSSEVAGVPWGTIIQSTAGLDYNSQSAATKKKWRKAFLYGMACHTATDAFAHTTYGKDKATNTWVFLSHGSKGNDWADRMNMYKNRAECAKYTAFCVAVNYTDNILGEIRDFSSYGLECWKGFRMRNLVRYVLEVNDDPEDVADLQEIFGRIDYKLDDITKIYPD